MDSLKCLSKKDVESMMRFVLSCKRHVDFIRFAKPRVLHVYENLLSMGNYMH